MREKILKMLKMNKNFINMPQKKAKIPCYGGFAQVLPEVGGRIGVCVAFIGLCCANLNRILPHLDAMSVHLKYMLSNWPDVGPQKKTKRKMMEKNHGFARFRNHIDIMLAHLCRYDGLSWGYIGLS